MCGLPGCSKPCYVERGRIHDFCGRTHATEHATMMDAVVASKKSKGKGSGSKTKGHQPQSHSHFAPQTQHSGSYTTSGEEGWRGARRCVGLMSNVLQKPAQPVPTEEGSSICL